MRNSAENQKKTEVKFIILIQIMLSSEAVKSSILLAGVILGERRKKWAAENCVKWYIFNPSLVYMCFGCEGENWIVCQTFALTRDFIYSTANKKPCVNPFNFFFSDSPLFVYYYYKTLLFYIGYDSEIGCSSLKHAATVLGWWTWCIVWQSMGYTFVMRFLWCCRLWPFCINNLSSTEVTVAGTLQI